MKICLVSQEYPPETPWGGIGTQTRVKAVALTQLGHEVHVLTRAADSGVDMRCENDAGVTVHRMDPPGHDFSIFGRSSYLFGYAWQIFRQLSKLMELHTFDICDFPEFGGEGLAYQLDRTCWNWIPVVVHLHGSVAMFAKHTDWPHPSMRFHRYGSFAEELSIREADGLMASCSSHADLISREYHIPRESIDVVHCGVDALHFCPPTLRKPTTRPTVLFVGNVVENKGIHTLAEAIFRLRSRYPNILLQVVGNVPERSGTMQNLTARLHEEQAESCIEFLGFVDANGLPALYQQADLFCLPSEFEGGTANVYLEAMACGCPVVASTAGGGGETITNGIEGYLISPNDIPAIATAIDRILSDPAQRDAMGRAARTRIESYFAMDRYVSRVIAVYEKTIARSQALPKRHEDIRD